MEDVLKSSEIIGSGKAGPGRPPGQRNYATLQGREAIAMFVDNNAERLGGGLDAIAKENPKAAFDAFMSVVEYHIPKLARSEVKVAGEVQHTVVYSAAEIASRLAFILSRSSSISLNNKNLIIEQESHNGEGIA